jgi:hypothetical protein
MTCADVRLDEYLDGELDDAHRRLVEEHLAACPDCRAELERSRKLEDLLRTVPAGAAPEAERFIAGVRSRSRSAAPWRMAAAAAVMLGVLALVLRSGTPAPLDVEALRAGLARYAAKPEARFEEDVRAAGPAGRAALEKALDQGDVRLQFAAATLLFKTADEATRERVFARFDSRKAANGGWVLGDAGAEDSDLELVPVAVSALHAGGQERWAIDVLRRLNRMGSAAQSRIIESVVTLLKSDNPKVQKLALDIVKELDIEFPLSAIVDLLDSPELGDEALKILRQATRKGLGKDKAAWRKAIE